jgi:spermidine synthase
MNRPRRVPVPPSPSTPLDRRGSQTRVDARELLRTGAWRVLWVVLSVILWVPRSSAAAGPADATPEPRPRAGRPAPSAAPRADECPEGDLLAGLKPWRQVGVVGDTAPATDGAVAPEGAPWDVPAAVRIVASSDGITYDLGRERSISALVLQADANDVYVLSSSADGSAGSFTLIGEVPNVLPTRGSGLRTRWLRGLPVVARYVRVAPGEGDGFFSISEIAAYCHTPTPFPPTFAEAKGAPVAARAPVVEARADWTAEAVDHRRDGSSARFGLLLFAAVLAFVGATGLIGKGPTTPAGSSPGRADGSTEGGAAVLGADAGPVAEAGPSRRARWSTHDGVRVAFAASGCAALIYEVVWFHLLRLVIGASALSVGIVLASFMGGMFLGSLFFARFVSAARDALRVYAFLEIGIGLFGLLMPVLLPAVRFVYVGLVGYGALGIVLRGVIAAILLLPPTALMGATLPVVARRYPHGRRGMAGLASLYAANTAGAVIGCLLSGFYLLAVWDVWIATITAAALNFGIGWFALRLARGARHASDDGAPVGKSSGDVAAPPAAVGAPAGTAGAESPGWAESQATRAIYLAAGLSGFTALGAQVVWTRLLTLLFGATVYAFSIILAVFLAGLGLGSGLAAYVLRRGQNPGRGLAWSQLALVPAITLAAYLLAEVLPYGSPPEFTPIRALHALHVLRALAVVLPAAVLWGMSFPFALAAAAPRGGDTGISSGRVYAANTLGAIVGSLGISFWAIPSFGTRLAEQALTVAAAGGAALLFRALALPGASPAEAKPLQPPGGWSRRLPPAWALGLGVLAAGVLPGPSTVFLAHGRYIWWIDPRDQYPYVSEGAASTVAVHIGPDGYKSFHVSGRVESSNNPNDLRLERMLGHLSALSHPDPESVLVVGLGGGVTAGALTLHPEIKRLVICEIEPRVAGAARQFGFENYDVLSNPKVEVVFDDARHFLATTREKFDIITSDPIHPWVRGNSVLFSREYYAVVKSKLKPGGIATQWVPLYETSEEAIRIQMKTFMDAFPDGSVWNSAANGKGYDVVLLGPTGPLQLDVAQIQARIARTPRIGESLRAVQLGSALDLLATYGAGARDMERWFARTPLNRDFSLKLEYISGLALNTREADDIYAHMVARRTYPDTLFVAAPELAGDLRSRILR